MEIKKASNEIAVFWHPHLKLWVVDSPIGIKRLDTYKQAQKAARTFLWDMNKDCELKNCKGQIFYSRKSDGLVTLNEYIGFDRKWRGWIIKGERMNLRRAA